MYKILHIPSATIVYERLWSFDYSGTIGIRPGIIKGMSIDLREKCNDDFISSAYPILFETKEIAQYYLDSHISFFIETTKECALHYIVFHRDARDLREYNIRQYEFEIVG